MEAEAKLAAEASPEEIKLILGWLMNFRELIVSLPDNKYIAWSADIGNMLTSNSAKAKQLETLLGRLGHLGMVIPFVYHFLSRLREWHHKSRNKRYPSQMTAECRQDLLLMSKLLDKAHVGIDMNLISYRRPTHVTAQIRVRLVLEDTRMKDLLGDLSYHLTYDFELRITSLNSWRQSLAHGLTS
jgi:hypothetical protein